MNNKYRLQCSVVLIGALGVYYNAYIFIYDIGGDIVVISTSSPP